jgi:hemerythrin-like domain-containing protein
MQDHINRWHAEHVNFARLLSLLEREFNRVHDGESPDYEMMLDIMYYMTHYPDLHHHPKEDLAFARLREREAKAQAMVDELTAQHTTLKHSGADLVQQLDDIVNGTISSRERLETAGRSYIEHFRSHIRAEEVGVLPMAARILSDEDWQVIYAATDHIEDPLFGSRTEARYAALREQIGREARLGQSAPR